MSRGLVLIALLVGCGGPPDPTAGVGRHGRYQGVGIYQSGTMWSRLRDRQQPADAAAATLADDEVVIVTLDAQTGEIRQCGNISGYCVAMNPWAGPLGRQRQLPARVTEHADEIAMNSAASNEAATR